MEESAFFENCMFDGVYETFQNGIGKRGKEKAREPPWIALSSAPIKEAKYPELGGADGQDPAPRAARRLGQEPAEAVPRGRVIADKTGMKKICGRCPGATHCPRQGAEPARCRICAVDDRRCGGPGTVDEDAPDF